MTTAVIIGTGNVARHLFDALKGAETVRVVQVLGRNPGELTYFGKYCETALIKEGMRYADIYIIAISDDAISTVSQSLDFNIGLVVHTSGSLPVSVLNTTCRKGVLYPLQTFSRDRDCNFREVPVCIEAEDPDDLLLLRNLAEGISDRVCELSFLKRRQLHLAAVFVNNFGNHLYYLAGQLLRDEALPFDMLQPLIEETAAKLGQMSPREAQTGPARRGDLKTMAVHRQLLEEGIYQTLYDLMSNSIQKTYAKNL
jgi:predicted short-subunit dehydrogenase-like oxidoreductase (DUF2520 family)